MEDWSLYVDEEEFFSVGEDLDDSIHLDHSDFYYKARCSLIHWMKRPSIVLSRQKQRLIQLASQGLCECEIAKVPHISLSMCKKNKRARLSALTGVFFVACLFSSFQFVSYGQPVGAYAQKDSLFIDSTALNVKTKDLSEVVVRDRKWAKISRYSALSMPLSTLDFIIAKTKRTTIQKRRVLFGVS